MYKLHLLGQILSLKSVVCFISETDDLFWRLMNVSFEVVSLALEVISSNIFLLYLRKYVLIDMGSPFLCKVPCNVVCSWQQRSLHHVNESQEQGKSLTVSFTTCNTQTANCVL